MFTPTVQPLNGRRIATVPLNPTLATMFRPDGQFFVFSTFAVLTFSQKDTFGRGASCIALLVELRHDPSMEPTATPFGRTLSCLQRGLDRGRLAMGVDILQ